MKNKIKVPGFVFEPRFSDNTETITIERQDKALEIEFSVFDKKEILEIAENLAFKKRRAHDRHIDEILAIIDQVGNLWADPDYDIRKEVLDVLPMMTGQSKKLCRIELEGTIKLWNRKNAETQLSRELGGKKYLEEWLTKGTSRIHAQPRGLVLHNMAGNAFNLGFATLFYGLVTKNVNLVKLAHGEPYVIVKLCESIRDVDPAIAKEMAAIYWRGSRDDIYEALFNSGYINCLLAWGGIYSIEQIRKKAYRYGIKIIDHGPKVSFCVISEDIFNDVEKMTKLVKKLAIDIVCWNQNACLSPRVIYIVDNSHKSVISSNLNDDYLGSDESAKSDKDSLNNLLDKFKGNGESNSSDNYNIKNLMERSLTLVRNSLSDLSPLGFARMLAEGLKKAEETLPRANLTHTDGLEMNKKREYFLMNYASKNEAKIFTPPNDQLDWTVVYLRNLPNKREIDMCQNRFAIVSRISSIKDLLHSIRQEELQQFLQTISIYGSEQFIKETAEELSLLGAYRFPRIGEHNLFPLGMPWDGHYVLQDMIKWVYLGFEDYSDTKSDGNISFF